MASLIRWFLSRWFRRSEATLLKHLRGPRNGLFEVERQLSRQLRVQFRRHRRAD